MVRIADGVCRVVPTTVQLHWGVVPMTPEVFVIVRCGGACLAAPMPTPSGGQGGDEIGPRDAPMMGGSAVQLDRRAYSDDENVVIGCRHGGTRLLWIDGDLDDAGLIAVSICNAQMVNTSRFFQRGGRDGRTEWERWVPLPRIISDDRSSSIGDALPSTRRSRSSGCPRDGNTPALRRRLRDSRRFIRTAVDRAGQRGRVVVEMR